MNDLEKFKIKMNFSIRQAIKQMDEAGRGFCVCVDNSDNVIGVISDGDFRRGVLSGVSLDENVKQIINKNFRFVSKKYLENEVKGIFQEDVVRHIPVMVNRKLVDIITEEKFFGFERHKVNATLDNPVVIMAGGKGKRLDPFTRILPKPLIPLGDDPIIKVIMDEFGKFGLKNFFVSLNDKGRMIKAYFHDHDYDYKIQYIEEREPLGTAGALKFLESKINAPFFLSNCDIIIHTDYSLVFDFHKKEANVLTLVGSMQQFTIPYGVCDIDKGGILKDIREKPEYDFLVNTGFYLLEPSILKFIPENQHFDMTDLIEVLKTKGLKVGVYPVSKRSWIDVGQWTEYKNMLNELNFD